MLGSYFSRIFSQGSRTYHLSSLFFPPTVRQEITTLYCYVRVADDLVDCIPQQVEAFHSFCQRSDAALSGRLTGDPVIDSFAELALRRNFERPWMEAFLESMKMDLKKTRYASWNELDGYMHGSAETIGAMISRILQLPEESYPFAMKLGKAMQLINFVRDVSEDLDLGRQYLPQEDLQRFGLVSLERPDAQSNPEGFVALIRYQIRRYFAWCGEAESGFKYLPKRYLVPIKTASDMYKWTAWNISRNPLIVYQHKIRPTRRRILTRGAINFLTV